jgi:hypothetical protein
MPQSLWGVGNGALVKINKRAFGHHCGSAALRVFIFGLVSKSPVRRIEL